MHKLAVVLERERIGAQNTWRNRASDGSSHFTGERSGCWGYEINVFFNETRNPTYNKLLRNAEGHDPEWLQSVSVYSPQ